MRPCLTRSMTPGGRERDIWTMICSTRHPPRASTASTRGSEKQWDGGAARSLTPSGAERGASIQGARPPYPRPRPSEGRADTECSPAVTAREPEPCPPGQAGVRRAPIIDCRRPLSQGPLTRDKNALAIATGRDSATLPGQRRSKDGAARRYLECGHPAAVQDNQPVTVGGPQHAGVLGESRHDLLRQLRLVATVRIFIGHVDMIAAGEPDPKHDRRHAVAR